MQRPDDRFILYANQKSKPCRRLLQQIANTQKQFNIVSQGFPAHIRGVPTLANLETKDLYEGRDCFDVLNQLLQQSAQGSQQSSQGAQQSAGGGGGGGGGDINGSQQATVPGAPTVAAGAVALPPEPQSSFSNDRINDDEIQREMAARKQIYNTGGQVPI
ncbi:hypothetical protein OAM67_01345 [bacterium]|nr:hypothetical protein [bacterium]